MKGLYHRWGFFFLHWSRRGRDLVRSFRNVEASSPWWWLELAVRLAELSGIFVLYETLAGVVKWNTRPLSAAERALVEPYFRGLIRLDLVRMDSWAFIGSAQRRFAYVTLHTVNCWRELGASVLVHELVHVWQYEPLGAAYIVRALRAQHSREGYNYGGVAMIRDFWTITALF
ncbi:MAG: hypothetical protein IPJ40_08760 [Saprospirales bacterium]|nr:hypothetical protein [Saprospirales bacterium]